MQIIEKTATPKMKKVMVLKVLVGFLFFFAFIQGIVNFVYELDDNKCEMTYMFEYPQYIVSMNFTIMYLF